jgi:hypothetical protein
VQAKEKAAKHPSMVMTSSTGLCGGKHGTRNPPTPALSYVSNFSYRVRSQMRLLRHRDPIGTSTSRRRKGYAKWTPIYSDFEGNA